MSASVYFTSTVAAPADLVRAVDPRRKWCCASTSILEKTAGGSCVYNLTQLRQSCGNIRSTRYLSINTNPNPITPAPIASEKLGTKPKNDGFVCTLNPYAEAWPSRKHHLVVARGDTPLRVDDPQQAANQARIFSLPPPPTPIPLPLYLSFSLSPDSLAYNPDTAVPQVSPGLDYSDVSCCGCRKP